MTASLDIAIPIRVTARLTFSETFLQRLLLLVLQYKLVIGSCIHDVARLKRDQPPLARDYGVSSIFAVVQL